MLLDSCLISSHRRRPRNKSPGLSEAFDDVSRVVRSSKIADRKAVRREQGVATRTPFSYPLW
jgi:hypothetical protein